MTQDEIVQLFRRKPGISSIIKELVEEIVRLRSEVGAVRIETLEKAAKVCEELRNPLGYRAESSDWVGGTNHCAAAIREMKL